MTLPACQQRVLDRVERSLHACDPRLRSMFAIFTKLTSADEMPRLEQLESRRLPLPDWLRRLRRPGHGRRTARGARPAAAPGAWLLAILVDPILLLALAPAAFPGLGASRARPGGPAFQLHNTAPAPSRTATRLPARQGFAHQPAGRVTAPGGPVPARAAGDLPRVPRQASHLGAPATRAARGSPGRLPNTRRSSEPQSSTIRFSR